MDVPDGLGGDFGCVCLLEHPAVVWVVVSFDQVAVHRELTRVLCQLVFSG